MRVLITRPEQDAREFAEELKKRGHESIIAPLLVTRFIEQPALDLKGVQGLLATSANGVRAFAKSNTERHLPLYAVGPQTAATARELGFKKIEQADGDAVALSNALPRWTKPELGVLLHIAGEDAKGKLKDMLSPKGFTVRMQILYGIDAADSLPAPAVAALAENRLDAVTLFSPRSASTFATLIAKARLEEACTRVIAVSISKAASDALGDLHFVMRRVAAKPNQDAMLDAISHCSR